MEQQDQGGRGHTITFPRQSLKISRDMCPLLERLKPYLLFIPWETSSTSLSLLQGSLEGTEGLWLQMIDFYGEATAQHLLFSPASFLRHCQSYSPCLKSPLIIQSLRPLSQAQSRASAQSLCQPLSYHLYLSFTSKIAQGVPLSLDLIYASVGFCL